MFFLLHVCTVGDFEDMLSLGLSYHALTPLLYYGAICSVYVNLDTHMIKIENYIMIWKDLGEVLGTEYV
ncbi:hypothetical protein ACJX0J_009102, partial [Zea mays]